MTSTHMVTILSRERIPELSKKSLGCVFIGKQLDSITAFKLEISSLTHFYDMLLRGQF